MMIWFVYVTVLSVLFTDDKLQFSQMGKLAPNDCVCVCVCVCARARALPIASNMNTNDTFCRFT